MYIDRNGMNLTRSLSDNTDGTQTAENAQTSADNSPGYFPNSPDTPSWGPPSGSDNSPGYFPVSPDTPSWGPPSGGDNSPGYFPVSPDTPSWGPPSGGNNNNNQGGNNRPVIIVPGQSGCFSCNTGSGCFNCSTGSGTAATVRFLHAAVNQPALNVRLGNSTVINNMQFGNSTPYYRDSNSQSTLVTVISAQTGRTLFQRYINFAGGTSYTVSIINDGSGITLFTLTDTPCNYRNSGCLRAVNLSPNSGAVDIFLSGYGRIFQGLNQMSVSGYNAVRSGSYRVSVSEALPCSNSNSVFMGNGYVECNNTRIAIMDTAALSVMSGVTYTLYIIGLAYQFPAVQILALESDLVY